MTAILKLFMLLIKTTLVSCNTPLPKNIPKLAETMLFFIVKGPFSKKFPITRRKNSIISTKTTIQKFPPKIFFISPQSTNQSKTLQYIYHFLSLYVIIDFIPSTFQKKTPFSITLFSNNTLLIYIWFERPCTEFCALQFHVHNFPPKLTHSAVKSKNITKNGVKSPLKHGFWSYLDILFFWKFTHFWV